MARKAHKRRLKSGKVVNVRASFGGSPNRNAGRIGSQEGQVWAKILGGTGTYGGLRVGDKFKFPGSKVVHTKAKRGYVDPKGRRFSTGVGTGVIKV